jgi:hypothetical protein
LAEPRPPFSRLVDAAGETYIRHEFARRLAAGELPEAATRGHLARRGGEGCFAALESDFAVAARLDADFCEIGLAAPG